MPDLEILDQFGRPISVEKATRPRPVELSTISQVQRWADPVANFLSPDRLASILRENDSGNTLDMLTLSVEMEERDLHYFSQVQQRKDSIQGAPLRVEAGDAKIVDKKRGVKKGSAKGEEIAEAFYANVVDTPEFRWLLGDLMDAVTKSYSVVQPLWDTTTRPWSFSGFEHFDPRCFMFDIDRFKELRIRVDGLREGRAMPAGLFLVHYPRIRTGVKLRGGLARLAAVSYMCKNFTVKSWLSFAEVYGMPIRIGRYDSVNTNEDDLAALRHALISLGHDAAAMMPKSVELDISDARRPTSGDNLFNGLAEYFDDQVSKAVNGQVLGSDSKASGIGSGNSEFQQATKQGIKDADALACAATIRTLARIWTQFNYGIDAPVPKLCIDVKPSKNKKEAADTLKVVAEALSSLKVLGKTLSDDYLAEEYGLELEDTEPLEPAAPAAAPGKPAPGKSKAAANLALPPALDFAEDAASGLLSDWEELLAPHLEAMQDAAGASDGYEEYDARLKKLASDIDSDPLVRDLAIAAMKARGVATKR